MYSLDSYSGDKKATSIRGVISGKTYPQCSAICPISILLRLIKMINTENNILLNLGIVINNTRVILKNIECMGFGENNNCGSSVRIEINIPK
jgi:hypothetical protein